MFYSNIVGMQVKIKIFNKEGVTTLKTFCYVPDKYLIPLATESLGI